MGKINITLNSTVETYKFEPNKTINMMMQKMMSFPVLLMLLNCKCFINWLAISLM